MDLRRPRDTSLVSAKFGCEEARGPQSCSADDGGWWGLGTDGVDYSGSGSCAAGLTQIALSVMLL